MKIFKGNSVERLLVFAVYVIISFNYRISIALDVMLKNIDYWPRWMELSIEPKLRQHFFHADIFCLSNYKLHWSEKPDHEGDDL